MLGRSNQHLRDDNGVDVGELGDLGDHVGDHADVANVNTPEGEKKDNRDTKIPPKFNSNKKWPQGYMEFDAPGKISSLTKLQNVVKKPPQFLKRSNPS